MGKSAAYIPLKPTSAERVATVSLSDSTSDSDASATAIVPSEERGICFGLLVHNLHDFENSKVGFG